MSHDGSSVTVPRGYRVGCWEVTELLGQGGWGTVYAARAVGPPGSRTDDVPDAVAAHGAPDDVALKFLPTVGLAPRQARDLVDSARREAELGRLVRHPRLVRMLDSVVIHDPRHPALDGAVVLVMERAESSLAGVLTRERTEAEAGRLLAEICEGLAQLHAIGWVHGDLKPGNVLVAHDGSARLSDFGLAVQLDGTHGYTAPMGTPDCLPPERWRAPLAEQGVRVRPTADIWAFGILVHQVFTGGASPFAGATPAARAAAVQEYAEGRAALRLDPALPPFWRELAADCLSATHEQRLAHPAEALLARIRTELDRLPATGGRPRRTKTARLTAAALALAAVCGALGAWLLRSADEPGAAQDGAGRTTARTTPSATSAPVRVYNAEAHCRDRTDRDRLCSLGLAIDPAKAYTLDNVVPTRVWHGDVLPAFCRLPNGEAITDEAGRRSVDWYRVRLPGRPDQGGGGEAWLPAVRTQDRPSLPDCPPRAPTTTAVPAGTR
ncbi:serine/threonine-protein kinase [Streptomyces sp. NPDC053431]|uniref:serine/threonine-protein kinase n=1 Tax=Streptomyces sp. NPDC053431 TaxID=3365703 RepID=UPI0037CDA947